MLGGREQAREVLAARRVAAGPRRGPDGRPLKAATRDAYGDELVRLGRENPAVVALDADLSKSTKTSKFAKAFPERFFNLGIAEQNLAGVAAGLAAAGKLPFMSTFAVFAAGRAYDQVRTSICYARQNVKIVATHQGITVGEDAATHQALEDIALMRTLPGMTVVVPADAPSTAAAIRALAAREGPCYVRLGRPAVPTLYADGAPFAIGRANVLRDGEDVAIAACGIMVGAALEAADLLAAEGIAATVLDLHTVKPLDVESLVAAAVLCGAVVTAEEHTILGGLGGAVAEALAEHHPVPLERVGTRDVFGESGTPEELLDKYGLTARDVAAAARQAVARRGKTA